MPAPTTASRRVGLPPSGHARPDVHREVFGHDRSLRAVLVAPAKCSGIHGASPGSADGRSGSADEGMRVRAVSL